MNKIEHRNTWHERRGTLCLRAIPSQWLPMAAASSNSVLLQTSRFDSTNARSMLFLHPLQVLSASALDQIPELFRQLEVAISSGLYVAGYVGYECGYHFQNVDLEELPSSKLPLAWFGVFREPLIFNHVHSDIFGVPSPLAGNEPEKDRNFFPDGIALTLPEVEYREKILRIQEYIAAGDTYQVNFTDSLEAQTTASAMELFTGLSRRQPVSYGAFLHIGHRHILSFSPELFFRIDGNRIVTRPMKGTMPRGLDPSEDIDLAARLQNDEKNRAEHVMIVDLLRNDLGRICVPGSVRLEDIFSVERYRTLFQMTSTISGQLVPETGYYDIFRSMFPGGAITGAPKIRTMQIIRELERRPRGVYTGAIGFIAPDRSSVFNVAIRTLVLDRGSVHMGIGGGIVADSQPADEYHECLLKANFLVGPQPGFQLLETMLWNGEFTFLSMHLDRMESSALYFDFCFDRQEIERQLAEKSAEFPTDGQYRVRLLLDSTGKIAITSMKHDSGNQTGRVRWAEERTNSGDVFLRHKTTHRERYDRLFSAAIREGLDDVIFMNERGEVTEGAINNLLVRRDGVLLTSPVSCGLLPGVFRRYLLETDSTVEESVVTVHDVESADAVYLCNSVRGIRPVTLVR